MRVSLATKSPDRISSFAILTAGLLCGVSVFFVALPLAQSSPFPTPRDGGWISETPPTSYQVASASYQVASASSVSLPVLGGRTPPAAVTEMREVIGEQAAVEWEALTEPAGVIESAPLEAVRAPERDDGTDAAPPATPEMIASLAPATESGSPPVKRALSPQEEVDEYLWEVYQRVPVKKDGTGDFTWKDAAAAKRMNMSLQTYVIGGMDRDFREQLYHAGRAMDADGIQWSMLSAFRDDYRQRIASGFKASGGNSLHGGSRATGGYSHGRAIDIINAEGNHSNVWRWVDRNGRKFGLSRPMPGADPAHIQAGGDWHRIASKLRDGRVKVAEQDPPGKGRTADKTKGDRTKVAKAAW